MSDDRPRFVPDGVPPRARIIDVRPIGVGTPMAERFTSVFSRLALLEEWQAPGIVALRELAGTLGRPHVVAGDDADRGRYFARLLGSPPASLNGNDRYAATWVAAVRERFGLDLASTTLLPWGRVLIGKGLLRAHGAYCAACYEEMRDQPAGVYEPLLWTLTELTVCVRHEVALRSDCPGCGAARPIFGFRGRPGHCGRCDAWLGRELWIARRESPHLDQATLDWQRWVTAQLGVLIATIPELDRPPSGLGIDAVVGHAVDVAGGVAALGRRIGRSKSVVSVWRGGQVLPSLPSALRVCAVAELDLASLYRGWIEHAAEPVPRSIPRSSERHRRIDWRAVELALRGALEQGEAGAPPTLFRVMDGFGLDHSSVRERFPALCDAVSRAREAWEARQRREERERRRLAITKAVAFARRRDLVPSRRRIEALAGFTIRAATDLQTWRALRGPADQ